MCEYAEGDEGSLLFGPFVFLASLLWRRGAWTRVELGGLGCVGGCDGLVAMGCEPRRLVDMRKAGRRKTYNLGQHTPYLR